nr:hypothetical protein GCM10020092_023400 [Actinoplanes digitatis]
MHVLTICVRTRYVKVYVPAVTGPESDRPDLAAMAARLARSLVAAERPVLAAHDVSMWGYVVLGALADEPMRTQAALARAIGADKTRIIGTLDELQERALIEREPDPDDRRVRLLRLTPSRAAPVRRGARGHPGRRGASPGSAWPRRTGARSCACCAASTPPTADQTTSKFAIIAMSSCSRLWQCSM